MVTPADNCRTSGSLKLAAASFSLCVIALCSCTPGKDTKMPAQATETIAGIVTLPADETPLKTAPEGLYTQTPDFTPPFTPSVSPSPAPSLTPVATEALSPSPVPTQIPTEEPSGTPAPTVTPASTPTGEPGPAKTPHPTLPGATPYTTPEGGETFDIVISVVGDCMLASYKNEDAANGFKEHANREDPSYFLEKVAPYFMNDDLTIANLECVLTDKDLPPVEKNEETPFWYYGKTDNTRIFTAAGVEAVSLANNHTDDYGPDGRQDTVAAVEAAGLLYAQDQGVFYYEKNGFKIAVICAQMFYRVNADDIVKLIEEASAVSDFQIVYYHGGRMRLHEPENWKQECSKKLVDAGADMVLGAHPHVLQPREIYKGVDIVYSLGNFCYGGSRRPENRTVIYQATLTVNASDGVLVSMHSEFIPCYVYTADVNNFQPAPITDPDEIRKVLEFMDWRREEPV